MELFLGTLDENRAVVQSHGHTPRDGVIAIGCLGVHLFLVLVVLVGSCEGVLTHEESSWGARGTEEPRRCLGGWGGREGRAVLGRGYSSLQLFLQ